MNIKLQTGLIWTKTIKVYFGAPCVRNLRDHFELFQQSDKCSIFNSTEVSEMYGHNINSII